MAASRGSEGVERRKHKRHASFIKAEMNGQPVTILDVSLGGIGGTIELRGDASDIPRQGDQAQVVLRPDKGGPTTLTVEVVRIEREQNLFGARIVEMGEEQFEFMKRYFADQPL